MVKSLNDYKIQDSITELTPQEKTYCQQFLQYTYKDNIETSELLLIKHARWSIIAAYYAMHDVSKLYLAKKFNLKFSNPEIHAAVIQAMRELVKRKDILELIENAREEYSEIISLHLTLLRGKKERAKTQYYTDQTIGPEVAMQKASYFLEKLAKPYLKLVEKLLI